MKEKNSIKFETLHKKINIKNIVVGVLVITLIVLVIARRVSHAAYTSSLDVPLSKGKINYKHPDFKVMGMYVQSSSGSTTYNETNTMPNGEDYEINRDKSYCYKGNTLEKDTGVVLKTVAGDHIMNNLTKNDRCFLYFDEANNVASILAKYTKDDSRSGEITAPFKESTPTTVYSKEDDDGTSYVFAGVNPNNWVKVGNIYFQIIRFNGNGSLRLIYSGENSPATSGEETQIGTSKFNDNFADNAYVGYMYGEYNADSYEKTHANINDSIIKTKIDNWYREKLIKYENFMDIDAGFCNNREVSFKNEYGFGQNETHYDNFNRYMYYYGDTSPGLIEMPKPLSSVTPDLSCQEQDLFTLSDSSQGNNALTYPVGTITVDEMVLAGGYFGISNNFWLNTNIAYWTLTPIFIDSYYDSIITYVNEEGELNNVLYYDDEGNPLETRGIRPVINLKSTTTFSSGTGEINNPYVVKT